MWPESSETAGFFSSANNPNGTRIVQEQRKNTGQFGPGNPGKPKGATHKSASLIRDMIAQALDECGGVEYLTRIAQSHPGPFLALVGKVMPVQVTGEDGGPLKIQQVERLIVDPAK